MNEKVVLAPRDACWSRVGVGGDRSCPELARVVHCRNCPVFAAAAREFLDRPSPEGYLEEVSRRLAEPAADRRLSSWSGAVFDLGGQTLAMETNAVVEVAEARTVHRVPHRTNRLFRGLVNIHGHLELCASLRGLLHADGSDAGGASGRASARLMVVERQGRRWVFLVDEVFGVHRFSKDDATEAPATSLRGASSYVEDVLVWGERRVGRLDVGKVFGAFEGALR